MSAVSTSPFMQAATGSVESTSQLRHEIYDRSEEKG